MNPPVFGVPHGSPGFGGGDLTGLGLGQVPAATLCPPGRRELGDERLGAVSA